MQLIKNILNGRLFGHPIHMMLVHFPAALFPLSAVLSVTSYIYKDKILSLFNFYIICAGSLLGWLALIFGVIDLFKIQEMKEPFKTALIHGGLNTLLVSVFSVIAGVQFKYYPQIPVPSLVAVIIEAAAVSAMIYTNYLGGELVLRYGVGKKEKPVHDV
jgi:uncharacterized membrane protein